jgi:hypothetical protein
MREAKLRDFLVYYKEADLWAHYKDKDIASIQGDVQEYEAGMKNARVAEFKRYTELRAYLTTLDVRASFAKYNPIDEEELAEIHKNHQFLATYWPKDIRGERGFIQMRITSWSNDINIIKEWLKSHKKRLEWMPATDPNRAKEEAGVKMKETATLPMALDEMDKLCELNDTYDKIEIPKLDWFKLTRDDPNFKTTEADFVASYKPKEPVTVRDIARFKAEQYADTLKGLDQYQLLAEIRKRFEAEPNRFPYWLQYMVVHFSGMRYASAHGSWADAKDLLVSMNLGDVQKKLQALTDAEVEAQCKQKIAEYESKSGHKLASATEKPWTDRVAMHLLNMKSAGPKTRHNGLTELILDETRFDFMALTTDEALTKVEAMKDSFPSWAWKQIVKLTPLRLKYVQDMDWEKLTPEEEAARNAEENAALNGVMNEWANKHIGLWRDEHGRTHELIVSRAVCNETAEHVQHMRGHLPPGGLAYKPTWYTKFERERADSFYMKPQSAADYKTGASILWLRFVDSQPSPWQIAKPVAGKDGVGLLADELLGKKKRPDKNATAADIPWDYKMGETVTRTRSWVGEDKKKVSQMQYLRWIHEATVAEVVETADETYVYTFETSLPTDNRGTSSVGMFRNSLRWNLSDGPEDEYNRSFLGYVPEGELPMEHLKMMLDWNRILLKQ